MEDLKPQLLCWKAQANAALVAEINYQLEREECHF